MERETLDGWELIFKSSKTFKECILDGGWNWFYKARFRKLGTKGNLSKIKNGYIRIWVNARDKNDSEETWIITV